MKKSSGRRWFLKSVSAIGAAAIPATARSESHSHQHQVAQGGTAKPRAGQPVAYTLLTPTEVAFVEAAVARLIPADELGPGGKEAGVSYFIDQQLAGAWGTMGRNYKQGPWADGTPQQGYQSALTPQELYRAAIREINGYCSARHGKDFDKLPAALQDEVLRGLEEGKIALETVPAQVFFAQLWDNTREGFFADPIYGGNRDKVGWKLVGFPGVAAAYAQHIENYNAPYNAEPVSIADMHQNLVQLDEHGHPQHTLLTKKD